MSRRKPPVLEDSYTAVPVTTVRRSLTCPFCGHSLSFWMRSSSGNALYRCAGRGHISEIAHPAPIGAAEQAPAEPAPALSPSKYRTLLGVLRGADVIP